MHPKILELWDKRYFLIHTSRGEKLGRKNKKREEKIPVFILTSSVSFLIYQTTKKNMSKMLSLGVVVLATAGKDP